MISSPFLRFGFIKSKISPSNIFNVNISLKYKLVILLMLLCVVPIMILGSISYNITSKIMINRVMKDSNQLVINKLQNINKTFEEIENIIFDYVTSSDTQIFLKYIDNKNFDTYTTYQTLAHMESKTDYILSLRNDLITSFMILPREGRYPFFRKKLQTEYTEYLDDFTKLPIYQHTLENKDKVLWTVSYEPSLTITVSRTINDISTGDAIGVMVLYLDPAFIQNMADSLPVNKNEYVFITDENNRIIYHTNNPSMVGKSLESISLSEEFGQSPAGSYSTEINDTYSIVTYNSFEVNHWKISYVIPYSNITADIGNLSLIIIAVIFICIFYSILMALFIFKYIYNPLKNLSLFMDKVAAGNLDIKITNKRKDEFGKIADTFNYMVSQIKKLVYEVELKQKMVNENEIKALQSQIMPHFLYNTLNSIKSLARMGRNKDIMSMVVALIRLLRVSTEHRDSLIPVRQELEYIKSYIQIMQFRYNVELKLVLDIQENILNYKILKFMIQPIVENCIVHAFDGMTENCVINISAFESNNDVHIVISDNGMGMDQKTLHSLLNETNDSAKDKFNRIGIRNVNDRIKLNFGKQYGIQFESEIGKGTSVSITLPRIMPDEEIPG
ncbi:MAG TPA: sensor histidine kinase [Clostridiaceae bacterium]|nr:sensor histidine kinase [Clostridiaceae bacterium]